MKGQTLVVDQEIVKSGIAPEPFDILLRLTKDTDTPELFLDELTTLLIEGLLDRYGKIVVKINWFSNGLTVIAPDGIPEDDDVHNALEGHSEPRTEAIASNPSPNTE